MPAADRDVITRAMGVTPVRLRACDVSPCRRDRYFWTNLPARTKRCVPAPRPPPPLRVRWNAPLQPPGHNTLDYIILVFIPCMCGMCGMWGVVVTCCFVRAGGLRPPPLGELPTFAEVLESGTPLTAAFPKGQKTVGWDGAATGGSGAEDAQDAQAQAQVKAGCIVRTVHTEWNMVRDYGEGGEPLVRALRPEEEVSPSPMINDQPGHAPANAATAAHTRATLHLSICFYGLCLSENDRIQWRWRQEVLMGMPRGHTAAPGLTAAQRHALIGNSFSVPVVKQLLRPMRALGEATTAVAAARAVRQLDLRERGCNAARAWCSECESAACIFVH
jgi:hypothetical protein